MRHHPLRSAQVLVLCAIAAIAALAGTACERNPAAVAEVQRVSPEQPRMQPLTVVGCLERGVLTDGTFVLLERAPDALSAVKAATYQLIGGPDMALERNVGKRVQISGTLESEQQISSNSGGPVENKTEGTAGSPRVETTTAVDVKKLRVESVSPMEGSCE